jgi:hypothetical protein
MGCSTYMIRLGSPAAGDEEGWRRMTMEWQLTTEGSFGSCTQSLVASAPYLAANRTACVPLAEVGDCRMQGSKHRSGPM